MDFNTYSDNCPIGNTGRKDNAYADYINKRTGQRGIRGTSRTILKEALEFRHIYHAIGL